MLARLAQRLLTPPHRSTDAPSHSVKPDVPPPGASRPFNDVLPVELWDAILHACDDRTFSALLNVCKGMQKAPSSRTLRDRINAANKKQFCPELPRDLLYANFKTLASGSAHLAKLTRNGPLLLDRTRTLNRAYFAPNSRFVIGQVEDPFGIRIYDLRGHKPRVRILDAHNEAPCIQALAYSPDCTRVFVASILGVRRSHVQCIYDLSGTNPTPLFTLDTGPYITAAAYSIDSKKLVTGDRQGNIFLWRFENGEPKAVELPGIDGYIYAAEFSPDGKRLAVGGSNGTMERHGSACIWDVQDTRPHLTHRIIQDRWACATRWSPDSRYLLIVEPSPKEELVWDLTGKTATPCDPDAHLWWTSKRSAQAYDFYAGARGGIVEVSDLTIHPAVRYDHRSGDAHVAIENVSPDGRFVVAKEAGSTRGFHLYDGHTKHDSATSHLVKTNTPTGFRALRNAVLG